MKDFSGKVAFITGGASGIGLGMARAFVRNGMKVVIADIREDHLNESALALGSAGATHFIRLDVCDRAAMLRAADETERVFGKIHVLCNNAGVGMFGELKRATYSDWDWGIGINLGGVINGIQTFLPRILAHGEGGHIVNTSSIGAVVPMPGGIIYIAAKCAVFGMTEALRSELEPDGIGVTLLCPGPTSTNIHEVARLRPERFQDTGFGDVEADLAKRTAPDVWMDPGAVGERVFEAMRRNTLFLMTHNEFKAGAEARFKAILAGFPPGEPDPQRIRALGFPVANTMYEQILQSEGSD